MTIAFKKSGPPSHSKKLSIKVLMGPDNTNWISVKYMGTFISVKKSGDPAKSALPPMPAEGIASARLSLGDRRATVTSSGACERTGELPMLRTPLHKGRAKCRSGRRIAMAAGEGCREAWGSGGGNLSQNG
eukprot:CAMPEP_0177315360 /NCGR_PEP_ID=MMETSP0368-20130122/12415_1 /TAXON_ID=447022 ORGANISM="Scrippsiella hangoei-like, Strain SHHI-4" /NCGR_SAMPLE_ID=MMETSP0368 /ASSEMBLY_ACC=CAM_ASM_000363 /LENGTH=130 /DNA_ID=CAMNT_0018774549 /DNA_START=237 /DNA_END=626 /DNA_ORIENTATION=-